MTKWLIEGADLNSGKDRRLSIRAATLQDAERIARKHGVLVSGSRVLELDPNDPPSPQPVSPFAGSSDPISTGDAQPESSQIATATQTFPEAHSSALPSVAHAEFDHLPDTTLPAAPTDDPFSDTMPDPAQADLASDPIPTTDTPAESDDLASRDVSATFSSDSVESEFNQTDVSPTAETQNETQADAINADITMPDPTIPSPPEEQVTFASSSVDDAPGELPRSAMIDPTQIPVATIAPTIEYRNPQTATGPVPNYMGLYRLGIVMRVVAGILYVLGAVILIFGAIAAFANPGPAGIFAAISSSIMTAGPLIIGLIVHAFGEGALALRDLARNSFQK